LHDIEESENQRLLSQEENESLIKGLKIDSPNEVPTTVTDDDPVITTSKGTDNDTNGTSTENTREIFDDCKNIETAEVIEWEILVADLAKTDDSDIHFDDTDAEKPSAELGDPMYFPKSRPRMK